jgi:hypothetical protein
MPGDPKACREHAKRCYQIAAEAHTLEGKKRFEDLAKLWLKLAADLESAQRLVEAWGAPLEPPAAIVAAAPRRRSRRMLS